MEIVRRDRYLRKLIERKGNGLIKVITGIRRCGKSFLLNVLFRDYLLSTGVSNEDIIMLSLDDSESARYRNPLELEAYIRSMVSDRSRLFYVFIDEIQMAGEVDNPYLPGDKITYVSVMLSLMKLENADLYVTGSNSEMLSSNIVTQFRDKGDEIHMYPLSFSEYCSALSGTPDELIGEYLRYGGLPRLLQFSSNDDKSRYLMRLLSDTYIKDVIERHGLSSERTQIDDVLHVIASSVGYLSNADRISGTLESVRHIKVSANRVTEYLGYIKESYIITEAGRYDIKGRRHIGAQRKYYFADPGLRNACLSFRQIEENHLMENAVFSELLYRGYDVSVGVVGYNWKDAEGKSRRSQLEVDFIAENADEKYYIQCAFMIPDEEKQRQEKASLLRIRDSFRKIIVVRDSIIPWHDEHGILYIGLARFLMDENALRL